MIPNNLGYRLCYIHGNWAFFTTQEVDKQWGDDWNDAPYEHNAGEPYGAYMNDCPKWKILKVAFDGGLEPPCESYTNSPYSVQDINNKKVPWLSNRRWVNDPAKVTEIWAGASPAEFERMLKWAGGNVYYANPMSVV